MTTDADHGRVEVRRHVVSHSPDWIVSDRRYTDEARLPSLAMIGMVEATVTRNGRTSTLRRFYLSSARRDAMRFTAAVRAHWRIENSLHWVHSTWTAPATDAITDPKTSPHSVNSPSTYYDPPDPTFPVSCSCRHHPVVAAAT